MANLEEPITEENIKEWKSYVVWIASKYVNLENLPSCISMEDIISQGMLGLIRATNLYDLSRGVQFKTYAFYKIRGAILDELGKLGWNYKYRRAKKKPPKSQIISLDAHEMEEMYGYGSYTISLHETLSSNDLDIHFEIKEKDRNKKLAEIIDALPERQKQYISLRYFEGQKLKEVGRILGLSESRACQLAKEKIPKLKKVLIKNGVTPH